jgi:hypothetical protein
VKKLVLIVVILAFTSAPGLAQAGGFDASLSGRQAPFFWRPFFYAGPVVYGYPAGLGYGYPGPYFTNESAADVTPYTYGYPGPYSYGVYGYTRPTCSSQPNGLWVCS